MVFYGVLYQPLYNFIETTERFETWQVDSSYYVLQNMRFWRPNIMKERQFYVIVVLLGIL